jgi:hypothetical protein
MNSGNPEADKLNEPTSPFYKPTESFKKKVVSTPTDTKNLKPQETSPSITMGSPSLQPNFSFDDIVRKWEFFIESISTEKGLTLGPALKGLNLLSLKENNLYFYAHRDEDLKTFRLNEKYLTKKSEEFFGRRFNYLVSTGRTRNTEETQSTETIKSKGQSSADPYEDIIINELGGEKIA